MYAAWLYVWVLIPLFMLFRDTAAGYMTKTCVSKFDFSAYGAVAC